jgi:hypothetical protein
VERDGRDLYWAILRFEDTGDFVRVKWERVEQYYPSNTSGQ